MIPHNSATRIFILKKIESYFSASRKLMPMHASFVLYAKQNQKNKNKEEVKYM